MLTTHIHSWKSLDQMRTAQCKTAINRLPSTLNKGLKVFPKLFVLYTNTFTERFHSICVLRAVS